MIEWWVTDSNRGLLFIYEICNKLGYIIFMEDEEP